MAYKNSFPWKQTIVVVLVLIVIAGLYIFKNPLSSGEAIQNAGESNSELSTKSDEMSTDSNFNQVPSSENKQTQESKTTSEQDQETEQIAMESDSGSEANSSQATEESTKNSDGTKLPKLVDLGSDNCIPCQEMAPILQELKNEYEGILDVEVVDVYEEPEKTDEYYDIHPIYVIPTQILFDEDGNEVWSHEGSIPKDELIQIFSEELGID